MSDMNVEVPEHREIGSHAHHGQRDRRISQTSSKSLSGTNFERIFRKIDTTATNLIAEATKASGNVRRACARIVVEGVRLLKASESATDDWDDLIKRELTDCGIKTNHGENFAFRLIANLIFRRVTKVKDDADLADSMISRGQITRYAQAMAWSYEKHKAGTDLGRLADEIVSLGGVRKVADQWAKATLHNSQTADDVTGSERTPDGDRDHPTATAVPKSCDLLGTMQPKGPLPSQPILAALYPDGSVYRLDLPEKQIAAIFSRLR